ncbi:MAG: hypothetical protein HY723_05860 [Chloroflexi bacterium]|nr:hypothetical protein [Chloroflexota bacterium]
MRALARLAPIAFLAALAAFVIFSWRAAGPPATQADTAGPRMALTVSGAGLICDLPADPTECSAPLGAVFNLSVEVAAAPAEGYIGFQTMVFYDRLTYLTRAAGDEIVWPESALPVRFPETPTALDRWVSHGDASGASPPLPASSHTGPVVELALGCSGSPSASTVALLPYDAALRPLGAGFRAGTPEGGLGALAPAKAAGTRALDVDGDGATEDVPVADVVDITCEGATRTPSATRTPTSTRTPSATATRTAMATPTPRPSGDVDCSGRVDAIDAALVLQLEAGLVSGLRCGFLGDVSGDGRLNSIDATLILQFVAGLLPAP